MSEERDVPVMLFVVSLFFIVGGIALCTITQNVTTYTTYGGLQVPLQETIQPYIGIGVLSALTGLILLIFAVTRMKASQA